MSDDDAEFEYLDSAMVAKLLRVTKPTVVAMVKRQGLPGLPVGKQWRFRRADVLAWIERQKSDPVLMGVARSEGAAASPAAARAPQDAESPKASPDAAPSHPVGVSVVLRMSPAAARTMAEDLLRLAAEGGQLVELAIGGEDPAGEAANG
ncbi:MAG: helix-turn-helix domain-containing protein [Polyangiaceae bacterium]